MHARKPVTIRDGPPSERQGNELGTLMRDITAQLVIPELHCPIPPAVNTNAAKLNRRIVRWMRANALHTSPDQLQRIAAFDLGTFAAHVCPDAGTNRQTLYARWLAFGFFYNDEFFGEHKGVSGNGTCRNRRRTAADAAMAAISAFVPGGMASGKPQRDEVTRLHRLDILTDLLARTSELARSEQLSRLGTQLNLWFSKRVYEPFAPSGHMAFAPYMALAEIVTGCPLSGEDLEDPDLRRLTDLAAERTAWCDRVHCAARQQSVDELIAELPPLLRHSAEQSPQRALDQAARVHDEAMRGYLRLERTLADGASPGTAAYLNTLRTWMRGHHDWRHVTHHGPRPPVPSAGRRTLSGFDVRIVMRARRAAAREDAVGADRDPVDGLPGR